MLSLPAELLLLYARGGGHHHAQPSTHRHRRLRRSDANAGRDDPARQYLPAGRRGALARAVNTPWYLHVGGGLSPQRPGAEAPDRYDYDPANPVPARGGALLMTPEYPAGPYDQRPIEGHP